jgi:hypothetical protein
MRHVPSGSPSFARATESWERRRRSPSPAGPRPADDEAVLRAHYTGPYSPPPLLPLADGDAGDAGAQLLRAALALDTAGIREACAGSTACTAASRGGWGALHFAAAGATTRAGDARAAAAVRALVASGLSVNTTTPLGVTPLLVAAAQGGCLTVCALLDAHADTRAADQYGATPLHRAAGRGAMRTVLRLLQSGASPAARDMAGRTPSDSANAAGFARLARILAVWSGDGSATASDPAAPSVVPALALGDPAAAAASATVPAADAFRAAGRVRAARVLYAGAASSLSETGGVWLAQALWGLAACDTSRGAFASAAVLARRMLDVPSAAQLVPRGQCVLGGAFLAESPCRPDAASDAFAAAAGAFGRLAGTDTVSARAAELGMLRARLAAGGGAADAAAVDALRALAESLAQAATGPAPATTVDAANVAVTCLAVFAGGNGDPLLEGCVCFAFSCVCVFLTSDAAVPDWWLGAASLLPASLPSPMVCWLVQAGGQTDARRTGSVR